MPRHRTLIAFGAVLGVATAVAVAVGTRGGGKPPRTQAPATVEAHSAPTTAPAPGNRPPAAALPAPTTTSTTTPTTTTATTVAPAKAVLAAMTLEEKVGQVFMVEVHGLSAVAPSARARSGNERRFGVETAAEVVEQYHVGGVVYFAHNVIDPPQVAAMSASLQRAAAAGPGIGLLIATDQEGGRVARIRAPATVFPAARVFGDLGDAELTERAAQVSARELRAMGINQVLAPVADVTVTPSGVIGDRSFGADPATVARQVEAAVRGYGAGGVAATVKHFPGHGGTGADSHVTLPVLPIDVTEWGEIHRPPFADAVAAGAPVVMVGHLALPALDPSGAPASLSEPLIAGALRGTLGFDGVVITDALTMDGVRSVAGDGEVAVQALRAGADLLLMPGDLATAYDAVLAAAREDPALAARLDEAVTRLLALKADLGVLDPPSYDPSAVAHAVGAPAHLAVLDEVRAAMAGAAPPTAATTGAPRR